MRLATIRTQAGTTAAQLDGDLLVPLDAADVGEWLAAGGERRRRERAEPVSVAEADFAPVVPRPGKIICVGLNYRAHILETGRELPELLHFLKSQSSIRSTGTGKSARPHTKLL